VRLLVDTNILLRFVDPDDPAHLVVVDALDRLLEAGHDVGFTPQVCREFWNVATRPRSANGFGLEPAFVDKLVTDLLTTFAFWEEAAGVSLKPRMVS